MQYKDGVCDDSYIDREGFLRIELFHSDTMKNIPLGNVVLVRKILLLDSNGASRLEFNIQKEKSTSKEDGSVTRTAILALRCRPAAQLDIETSIWATVVRNFDDATSIRWLLGMELILSSIRLYIIFFLKGSLQNHVGRIFDRKFTQIFSRLSYFCITRTVADVSIPPHPRTMDRHSFHNCIPGSRL